VISNRSAACWRLTCLVANVRAVRQIPCRACRRAPAGKRDDASARGAEIAARGIPARDIPPYAECHGPSAQPKSSQYPRLAGQHVRYLMSQLELLKEERRGGSPNVNLMQVFVHRLRQEEIRDAARYYAALADR
jgi:cytochrome c553